MKRTLAPAWQPSSEPAWQTQPELASGYGLQGPSRPQLDFAYWLEVLLRQWRLIAAVVVTGVALTLLAVMMIPPRYAAIATIVIDNQSSPVVFGTPVAADVEGKLKIDDEVEILGSRRIAASVFGKIDVPAKEAAPAAAADKRSWWEYVFPTSQAKSIEPPARSEPNSAERSERLLNEPEVQDGRVDALLQALNVERKGRSNVVNVTFVDTNPRRAAKVANAFVDTYIADQLEVKTANAQREVAELERQADLASKQLEEIEQRQPIGQFKREIEVASTLYGTVLQRLNEKRAQQKLLTADVRIVSYAVTPGRPVSPKKTLIVIFSTLAWLGLGIGAALTREHMHPLLRSPKDVERALGVPCVATLPVVDLSPVDEEDTGHDLAGPIHEPIEEQRSWQFSRAAFALSQWTDTGGNGAPRIAVVVSAHRAEGSSTVAVQLARSAAATGRNVLLVDADLRNFGLSDAFGGAQPTTYVERVGEGNKKRFDFVALDERLSFCPALQRGDWRPLEVVGSRGMGKFFASLEGKYDLVVVDTPSMADGAEAEALAAHADLVLVVVKANETEVGDVRHLIERLENGRSTVGVVLNMAG